jgi:hypothetical protein
MRWISSAMYSLRYDVLPKHMGSSNHGLNPMKPWTKTNPLSF